MFRERGSSPKTGGHLKGNCFNVLAIQIFILPNLSTILFFLLYSNHVHINKHVIKAKKIFLYKAQSSREGLIKQ